ncbi:MAG: AraC family transcriptional regulator [Ruminococcaceae bacterium]|nr:AraC family transcriptional regulator [Oscillospiraceae bacterium]
MNYVSNLYYYLRVAGKPMKGDNTKLITFYHLMINLKGNFVMTADGEEYILKENDALLIPPGSLRKREHYPESGEYIIFNFHMPKEKAITTCTHFKNAVSPFVRNLLSSYTYKYYNDVSYPYKFYIMPNQKVDDSREQAKIKAILHNVLNCIMIEFLDTLNYSTDNKHVITTIRYINDHIFEPITLSSVCEAIHLSKEYVSRLFRKEMNMTVTDYITGQKLSLAKNLLTSDEMTLQNISERIGYQDYNYFSRTFKKHYGISPIKMKKEMLKK